MPTPGRYATAVSMLTICVARALGVTETDLHDLEHRETEHVGRAEKSHGQADPELPRNRCCVGPPRQVRSVPFAQVAAQEQPATEQYSAQHADIGGPRRSRHSQWNRKMNSSFSAAFTIATNAVVSSVTRGFGKCR